MQNDLTDITFLLDRSGSMHGLTSDVVGGINFFVDKQKAAPGDALFTLIQFDSFAADEIVYYGKPIKMVPKMEEKDFIPRGSTPLLDAFGLAVVRTGERLAKMPEAMRPGKVVFVCYTDGLENASTEYKKEQIAKMIKHQQEQYKWEFLFLGAGIDAFSQGAAIGINFDTTMMLNRDQTLYAIETAANNVADYRSSGVRSALHYTKKQREQAMSKTA